MAPIRGVTKDFIITAFAALTSALTAYVLALVATKLHFAIYAVTLWLVIPIGAIACGAAAASGYHLGFRLFPHPVTRLLAVNAILLSIATYFLVYYVAYSMMEVRGEPVARLVPFEKFLAMAIEGRRDINRLESLNYIRVAIQIAGFAIGGFLMVRPLYSVPCCDSCDRKLTNPRVIERASNSLLGLEETFQRMRTSLASGNSAQATSLLEATNSGPANAIHKLHLSLWKCEGCGVEYYSMFIKPGGEHVGHVRDYCPARTGQTA